MALYFLSYDLRKRRDYDKLYAELERFNAVRMLESQWCFKRMNTSAGNLRDHFKQFIDSDDGLSVAEVSAWGTYNTLGTPKELG